MKLPALQFYPADWRKDPGVQSLNYFDRGVWFEILCLMHESSERGKLLLNGKAMPDDALARVLGLDNQTLSSTLTTLLTYGVASRDDETGALINRRMVNDDRLRKIRAEAGKKGGNPALLKHTPTNGDKQNPTTRLKQIPTPSSSSSVSSSDVEERGYPFDHFAVLEYANTLRPEPGLSIFQAETIAAAVADTPESRATWTSIMTIAKGNDYQKKNAGNMVDRYQREMAKIASGERSPLPTIQTAEEKKRKEIELRERMNPNARTA
jgi:hypothetical protein